MRILVVSSHALSRPGYIATAAQAARARLILRVPPDGDALPQTDEGFDGLVILGGPMGACDDDEYPHLRQSVDLLRRFHAREKPVLGVCLGAQLIARAFGKRITRHVQSEVGYYPIRRTHEALGDALLDGVGDETYLMQYRQDTFELPDDAIRLMTDEISANQGFRLGPATYGFQPHFEVTPEFSRRWIATDPEFVESARPGLAAIFERELARHDPGAKAFCLEVTTAWLALARARAETG